MNGGLVAARLLVKEILSSTNIKIESHLNGIKHCSNASAKTVIFLPVKFGSNLEISQICANVFAFVMCSRNHWKYWKFSAIIWSPDSHHKFHQIPHPLDNVLWVHFTLVIFCPLTAIIQCLNLIHLWDLLPHLSGVLDLHCSKHTDFGTCFISVARIKARLSIYFLNLNLPIGFLKKKRRKSLLEHYALVWGCRKQVELIVICLSEGENELAEGIPPFCPFCLWVRM